MSLPRQLLPRIAHKHWGSGSATKFIGPDRLKRRGGWLLWLSVFLIADSTSPLPTRPQRAGALTTCLMACTKWRLLAAVKSVLPPTFWADRPETGGRRCANLLNCPESLDVQDICSYDSSMISFCPQIGGAV